jgi:hypothetical protein
MSPGLHHPHSFTDSGDRGNADSLYFSVLSFQKYQSFLKAIFFPFLISIINTSRNPGFSTTIYRTTFHLI